VRWQRVGLEPVSSSTQVVTATKISPSGGSPYWVVGGATAAAPPERKPAVWMSSDLTSFVSIPMNPNPGYGEIAEVFGVAGRGANGDDLAGIAQAFGGAHGNPRTASWDGSAAGLSEIRTNFELYNGIRQISVKAIAVNARTYTIIGSRVSQNGRLGAASWTSTDGSEFTLWDNDPALSSAPNEQLLASDVAVDPEGQFVAAGERLWWDPANSAETIQTDGIVWRSANGQTWERWNPPGFVLTGKGDQRIQKVIFSNGQLFAAGTETVGGKAWVTVWGPTGKERVAVFGPTDDPLSGVTSVEVMENKLVLGVRMAGRLRLATQSAKSGWRECALPVDLPTGGRAKLLVVSGPSGELLIGAAGLERGGMWRRIP
jgi:hypothetical protein